LLENFFSFWIVVDFSILDAQLWCILLDSYFISVYNITLLPSPKKGTKSKFKLLFVVTFFILRKNATCTYLILTWRSFIRETTLHGLSKYIELVLCVLCCVCSFCFYLFICGMVWNCFVVAVIRIRKAINDLLLLFLYFLCVTLLFVLICL